MNENFRLPVLASKLIKVALNDLEKIEVDDRYIINMDAWHDPTNEGKFDSEYCEVCLAGAVMAKTGKAGVEENVTPDNVTNTNTLYKLKALDYVRLGLVQEFFTLMPNNQRNKIFGLPANKFWSIIDHNIPPYKDSPKRFKNSLRSLIKKLEKVGL